MEALHKDHFINGWLIDREVKMNLFRLPCFGKQSSFYSYFMSVIFVMFWLACIMLVTIVNWIDFKYPLCLLMGDNYNRGVGECHNSSKRYILCIIAIRSMKILDKNALYHSHISICMFFLILIICFRYPTIGNVVYTHA